MTPGPALRKTDMPQGFTCCAINSGVRKYRPDLGAIISDVPAVAAGVFTVSTARAAPVLYCESILPSNKVRAIITNSGQANAATGKKGVEDNLTLVSTLAKCIDVDPSQVLVASTGVIGVPLDMEKLTKAIPEMLERQNNKAETFACAIMTTDLVPKTVSTVLKLSMGEIRITGICKGSGMIHPNMATMLGYVLTDVSLPVEFAKPMLKDAVDESFNMISVDGETSTNDGVFLLANGVSGVGLVTEDDIYDFKKALTDVCIFLAKSIAQDGEGATKLIEANVKGLSDLKLAREAAKGIIQSALVKTAIHGCDPNWGRIYARLGQSGVGAEFLEKLDISVQGVCVFENGAPKKINLEEVRAKLKEDIVVIDLDFKSGLRTARAWGCDLSAKYVQINAEYMT